MKKREKMANRVANRAFRVAPADVSRSKEKDGSFRNHVDIKRDFDKIMCFTLVYINENVCEIVCRRDTFLSIRRVDFNYEAWSKAIAAMMSASLVTLSVANSTLIPASMLE